MWQNIAEDGTRLFLMQIYSKSLAKLPWYQDPLISFPLEFFLWCIALSQQNKYIISSRLRPVQDVGWLAHCCHMAGIFAMQILKHGA
jgi:hypothetical protein